MGKSSEPWYFKYLRRELSRVWGWSPERKECKKRARYPGGGLLERFQCEDCGRGPLTKGQYQIDHVEPRENVEGWDGWDSYIWRTFAPVEMLQLLCLDCHKKKTVAENSRRAARKRAAKSACKESK